METILLTNIRDNWRYIYSGMHCSSKCRCHVFRCDKEERIYRCANCKRKTSNVYNDTPITQEEALEILKAHYNVLILDIP